jgi:hypothetical protein
MTSSRVILGILAIILLAAVLLSSGRLKDIFKKTTNTTVNQVKDAQVTPFPTLEPTATQTPEGSMDYNSSEIPSTGPSEVIYLLLAGSLVGGLTVKKFKG